jgi:alpha-glucosidase
MRDWRMMTRILLLGGLSISLVGGCRGHSESSPAPVDGRVADFRRADGMASHELADDPDLPLEETHEDGHWQPDSVPSETLDAGQVDASGDLCSALSLTPDVLKEDHRFSLTCPNFSLEIEPVLAGVFRLNYVVAEPQPALPYALSGFVPDAPAYTYGADGDRFMICTPLIRLEVALPDCQVTVRDAAGRTLLQDAPGGAVSSADETFHGASYASRTLVRKSPPDEVVFGLGEKTGPLDRRGKSYFFWNSDTPGYPVDHDPLYQSIPFYVGMAEQEAYGVFLNNSWPTTIDVGDTQADEIRITALAGDLDQYVIAGPAIQDVLQRYTALTGRPPMPPRWSLGYHQARWSYTPDQQVLEIAGGFRSRGIPADAIWLDIDYMDGFRSFTWHPVDFADPAGLTSDLATQGFKTVAIIDPGLKADADWPIYQQGVAQGHFLMGPENLPFVGEVWPGASVFPDFTRPETRSWWASLFPAIVDVGVRGVWLDMNEPANFLAEHFHTVPGYVSAHSEGQPRSMDGVHNSYALAEAMASYQGLLEAAPEQRPFLLTRAGFAGIQRYAAVWTGDAASNMPSLKATFTMLLAMGLSGLPFVGSDVGGWTGSPSPELFARWLEVGSISPFFRTHVATDTPDQEPWSFGVEVEEIAGIHIRERYRLLPYFYSLFYQAHQTGLPLLRAMPLEFQQDPTTYHLSTQAMVGPWLLVAPVLHENVPDRTAYLPAGQWLEWHSGRSLTGPGYVTVDVSLQALPLFLRPGAIVPSGPVLDYSDQAPLSPLQLDLLPGPSPTSFSLYEDDGETREHLAGEAAVIRYDLASTPTGATLTAGPRVGTYTPPARPLRLRFRPVDKPVSKVTLNGAPLPEIPQGATPGDGDVGYRTDPNDRSLWVFLPDQDQFVVECGYDSTPLPTADEVVVTLQVQVPEQTPDATPIYVATSANDWAQQPLDWTAAPGVAQGQITVPRGQWFEYKYTRGDWTTVEKWSGCLEATNRYAFGQAHPVKQDAVQVWADQCQ